MGSTPQPQQAEGLNNGRPNINPRILAEAFAKLVTAVVINENVQRDTTAESVWDKPDSIMRIWEQPLDVKPGSVNIFTTHAAGHSDRRAADGTLPIRQSESDYRSPHAGYDLTQAGYSRSTDTPAEDENLALVINQGEQQGHDVLGREYDSGNRYGGSSSSAMSFETKKVTLNHAAREFIPSWAGNYGLREIRSEYCNRVENGGSSSAAFFGGTEPSNPYPCMWMSVDSQENGSPPEGSLAEILWRPRPRTNASDMNEFSETYQMQGRPRAFTHYRSRKGKYRIPFKK